MLYFKKINLANAITDGDGKPIVFESTNDSNGIIAVDEVEKPAVAAALNKFADDRLCGVIRISKEIYDALFKKKDLLKSQRRSSPLNQLRVAKQPDPFNKNPVAEAAAAVAGSQPKVDLRPELPPNRSQFMQRTRQLKAGERPQT